MKQHAAGIKYNKKNYRKLSIINIDDSFQSCHWRGLHCV